MPASATPLAVAASELVPATSTTPAYDKSVLETTAYDRTTVNRRIDRDTPNGIPFDSDAYAEPKRRRGFGWVIGVLLVMALAGGAFAWYSKHPATSAVPALAGMEDGVALNQIAGTFNAVLLEESSEVVPVGIVIRTDPAAGAQLEHGKDLLLVVSSGPAPRLLPELTNVTIDQATATLEGLGLVIVTGEPQFSDTVPLDVVLSWTVPDSPTLVAGDTVTKGTVVQVVLSSGPEPRTVPELTGTALAVATTALDAETLLIAVGLEEFSATIPIGHVISQSPIAGTVVEFGTTVTVILSKGPDLVSIPSLAGLNPNGVTVALRDAGFTLGTIDGNTALPFKNATVAGVLVAVGQQFPRGTVVDVHYTP